MFKKPFNRAPFYGGLVLFSLVFFFLPNQQNVFADATNPCNLVTYVSGHKDQKISLLNSKIDVGIMSKGGDSTILTFNPPFVSQIGPYQPPPATFHTTFSNAYHCPSDVEDKTAPFYVITPVGKFAASSDSVASVGTQKTLPVFPFFVDKGLQFYDFGMWFAGQYRSDGDCKGNQLCLTIYNFFLNNPSIERTVKSASGSFSNLDIAAEDAIIESIAASGNISVGKSDGTKLFDIPATNCVKLSGDGPIKVVFMRGKSWNSDTYIFESASNAVINNGFAQIDPFKKYLDRFSFYIDLRKHDDSVFPYRENLIGGSTWRIFAPEVSDILIQNSSCPKYFDMAVSFFDLPSFYDAFAVFYKRVAYMNTRGYSKNSLPRLEFPFGKTMIHEFAHAVFGLDDEFLRENNESVDIYNEIVRTGKELKNCVLKPSVDFHSSIDNRVYGAVSTDGTTGIEGCSYLKSVLSPKSNFYRPSITSIMSAQNDFSSTQFNVISCGYLIAGIRGEETTKSNAQKYWPECLEMAKRGTVIMDGIPPVSSTPNTTTPTTNSASEGSMVSINGSGFTSEGNAVQFTNTATGEAYEVLDISSNGSRIDFLVPIDAPPGNYTLKVGAFNSEWAPPTPFTITAVKAPVISLVASPNPVSLGSKTTITWLVQGASSCDSDSTMDKPPVEWSNPGVSGSFSLALADSTEFSLKCAGPGGTASQDLQVNTTISPPLVSLSVTSRNIKVGEGVTIAWSTERAQRCAGVGGGDLAALAAWNKTQPLTGSMYLAPNQTTSLALRCTGIGGTTAVSPVASILVAPLPLSFVPVSVSCSVSNASGAYRQLITYTANITGGDGKYTYNWSSADGLIGADKLVSTYYYNPTNTKAVAYKTANVTASSGGQNATAQCPSIPINASTPVSLIPLPYISSINPLSGSVGAMITLTGSPNNSGLRFNSTTQQSVFVKGGGKTLFVKPYSFGADGYSLNFVLPPLPSSFGSALDIGVTSGGVGAYESNAVRFTLAAPQIPIPSITSIIPSNGILNTSITLTGKNFAADSAVLIQRDTSTTVVVPRYTPVTPPVATESLIFTFSSPQVAAGQYDIKVSNKGVLSNAVKFSNTTNIALPVVTMSITPVSGPDGQNKYTLTWGATNAVSCALAVQGEEKGGEDWSGFAGSVGVFGTITNSVTSLTTFTMTCTGPGGTDSKSTTVTPEFELKSDSGNDNLANIISAFKHIFQVVFEPFINLFKIK